MKRSTQFVFQNAQSNLEHYITLCMEEIGLKVDSDTHSELSEIIAPIGELFADLEKRVDKLEDDRKQEAYAAMESDR